MKLRLALAQINATVGDLSGNRAKMTRLLGQARRGGAQLAVFPELAVTGYPPEDLLFKPNFIRENIQSLRMLARSTRGIVAVVGFVDRDRQGNLYNAAALLSGGKVVTVYRKVCLPNYGVFDEKRYFKAGQASGEFEWAGRSTTPLRVGISICEDIWEPGGPAQRAVDNGAKLILNLSASPYHAGKLHQREQMLRRRAKTYGAWVAYLNLVGGQDELVFDGGSLVVDPKGVVRFRSAQFQERLDFVEIPETLPRKAKSSKPCPPCEACPAPAQLRLSKSQGRWRASRSTQPVKADSEIFQALCLGLQDYVTKNGFGQVVLGLSGGIDSALTAAVAVAALGPKAVVGVSMPSQFSSSGTQRDAKRSAKALGIRLMEIPIEQLFRAYQATLSPAFAKTQTDVTEENLQARIRGSLLMALSNKFGWLVLATGNKSELSTGYCTLYGDMVGGFAVIKDLPKGWVNRMARTANRHFGRKVIPDSVLKRPPSAELRPNQRDQDTLPPYRQLDAIMRAYVEGHRPASLIQKRLGYRREVVDWMVKMIDLNEYKRRQAPPGIKITPLAFGRDRRMPITNRFQEA